GQRPGGGQAQQPQDLAVGRGGPRRALAARGEPVEGGQGPAGPAWFEPLGWSAAAAVHRARDRGRAERAAHGRAVLGPRPDIDARDRGAHQPAQGALHDRHRDAQHAAGGSGLGPYGLLQHREHGRPGPSRRDRRHGDDVLQPVPAGDRGLHLGPLRLSLSPTAIPPPTAPCAPQRFARTSAYSGSVPSSTGTVTLFAPSAPVEIVIGAVAPGATSTDSKVRTSSPVRRTDSPAARGTSWRPAPTMSTTTTVSCEPRFVTAPMRAPGDPCASVSRSMFLASMFSPSTIRAPSEAA